MGQESVRKTVGSLKISKDVIASITGAAVLEVDGVDSLMPAPMDFKSFVLKSSEMVKIEMAEGMAEISVYVNILDGTKIPQVAKNIQQNVKESVQNMTDITVSKVNVSIQNVVFHDRVGR